MANQQSKSRDQKRKAKLKAREVRCRRERVIEGSTSLARLPMVEMSSTLDRRLRRQAEQDLEFMNEQDNRLILLALGMLSGSSRAQEQFHTLAAEMIADGREEDVDSICWKLLDLRDQMQRRAEAAVVAAEPSVQGDLKVVA